MPPRSKAGVACFNSVCTVRIVKVGVFVDLYNADAVKQDDVQGAFGSEESCQDVLASQVRGGDT